MKLFAVHCGFYDEEVANGVYEFHVNISVVANSVEEAKKKVRLEPSFIKKKMHIDGIQEIKMVCGYQIVACAKTLTNHTEIDSHLHRDF